MSSKDYYVYILSNKHNGVLYIGVTNDLVRRIYEHKGDIVKGFSSKYKTHLLVHYELFTTPEEAIYREKQLKNWKRQWKVDLINGDNPAWRDLYSEVSSDKDPESPRRLWLCGARQVQDDD